MAEFTETYHGFTITVSYEGKFVANAVGIAPVEKPSLVALKQVLRDTYAPPTVAIPAITGNERHGYERITITGIDHKGYMVDTNGRTYSDYRKPFVFDAYALAELGELDEQATVIAKKIKAVEARLTPLLAAAIRAELAKVSPAKRKD